MNAFLERWFSFRESTAGSLRFMGAVLSSALIVYEVFSLLHWLSTKEFFHHSSCDVINMILGAGRCQMPVKVNFLWTAESINWLLGADVFFGALTVIVIIGIIGGLISPKPFSMN